MAMTINPHLRDIFNLRRDRSGFFPVAEDAVRVVSPAQALEIFDTLRAMQNISHEYTDDGCAQRAHLMCRALVDMKLAPEKGWAFETPKRDLVVDYPHVSQIWWFHVAPVLRVASEKGGAEPMAFDTVLFDGPATMKEWGSDESAARTNPRLALRQIAQGALWRLQAGRAHGLRIGCGRAKGDGQIYCA